MFSGLIFPLVCQHAIFLHAVQAQNTQFQSPLFTTIASSTIVSFTIASSAISSSATAGIVSDYGFTGKYHSVRRFAGTLVSCNELPVRRIEVEAGQEMQIDYGQGARYMDQTGKLRKTYIFRRVLSHSRKGDTEVVTRLTTESLIRSLENTFGALINRTIEKTLVAVVDAYGVAAVIGWRIGSWIAPIVVKTGSLIDDGASAFQSRSEFTQGHRGTEGFHLDGSISVSW